MVKLVEISIGVAVTALAWLSSDDSVNASTASSWVRLCWLHPSIASETANPKLRKDMTDTSPRREVQWACQLAIIATALRCARHFEHLSAMALGGVDSRTMCDVNRRSHFSLGGVAAM